MSKIDVSLCRVWCIRIPAARFSTPPPSPASAPRCRGARRSSLLAAPPTFEEIAPSVSGLTWVHENAMSPERFLPETMGPGMAFFDYDNDGWMDVLMVNSGPADFYTPKTPLKHALYKNNRDGSFTDVTEKAGIRRRHTGRPAPSGSTTTTTAGLGSATSIDWLEIKWPLPSGKVERFTKLPVDR